MEVLNFAIPLKQDQSVRLWDKATGECQAIYQEHKGSVWCLQFRENLLLTGSADQTIKSIVLSTTSAISLPLPKFSGWDLEAGHSVATLTGHSASIASIHFFSPFVLVGYQDMWVW